MFEKSLDFARKKDRNDPLSHFRDRFYIPLKDARQVTYFCGNSLGLQPKNAENYLTQELEKWQQMGVEGHFGGENPWVYYHHHGKEELSDIVGAKPSEVVAMNNLTTNLHLMLASFYRPAGKKTKIIIESGAFPSDHYAVSSFMKILGRDPEKELVLLEMPEDGYISTEVIKEKIFETGDELALVMLPGIQYYTGQYFDMKEIAAAAHQVDAFAGFDLAHAVGNVDMNLHEDQVDFAVWCSYKYLNSGPGNVAGTFVHEKHSLDPTIRRLTGWWGHNEKTRFQMDNNFDPMPGVDGWMLSNVNILATSIHLASLQLFKEAGMSNLRKKSIDLTGYLEFLIKSDLNHLIRILTPENPDERGCQLSLYFHQHGRKVFEQLSESGYIMDWREPNVIRVAPTPLYNTYSEVYQFIEDLKEIVNRL